MSDIVIINGKEFSVVVAITDEDHSRGLMFRLPPTPIMAFAYNKADVRKFWMHNTPAPLDIIFCNAGKVIDIQSGVPFSKTHLGPDVSSDLVIEMPAGYAKQFKVTAGSIVELKMSIPTIAAIYSDRLTRQS